MRRRSHSSSSGIERYEFDSAAAILLIVIGIVILTTVAVSEWVSARVHHALM